MIKNLQNLAIRTKIHVVLSLRRSGASSLAMPCFLRPVLFRGNVPAGTVTVNRTVILLAKVTALVDGLAI